MTGRHEVRVFEYYPESSVPLRLPEGWKPFSAYLGFGKTNRVTLQVVARRWIRSEPEATADGEAEA